MNHHHCHCDDQHRARLSGWVRTDESPKSVSGWHRSAWRNALSGLASPIVRLHQLRNLRTQMLRNALDDMDACRDEDEAQDTDA